MDYTFLQYNPFFLCKKGEIVKLCNKSSLLCLITIFFSSHTSQKQNFSAISTIPQAIIALRSVILNVPADNAGALHDYEKEQSGIIIACAKVLYDIAYAQILVTLQEINNRLAYWQYQKNHPWGYFLAKNPVKWFTGVSQQDEINNNIEQLQSHQGELYVMLGQLAEYGNVYDHTYKTIFKNNYVEAYAWIDGLLDVLARIKIPTKDLGTMSPLIARVTILKAKLEKVRFFKNQILSEMKETQIPAHLARHWLKYGAGVVVLGYGYKNIGVDQLKAIFESLKTNVYDPIMMPVRRSINVLFPEEKPQQNMNVILPSLVQPRNVTADLAKQYVIDMGSKYGIGDIHHITGDMDKGNYGSFEIFLADIAKKEKLDASKVSVFSPSSSAQNVIEWAANQSDYVHGLIYLIQLLGLSTTGDIQKFVLDLIEAQKRDFKGVRDLLLLTPAALVGGLGYLGYKKYISRDYTLIRRAF